MRFVVLMWYCVILAALVPAVESDWYDIQEGDPYKEYSSQKLDNTFVLADQRGKSVGRDSFPFYHNLRVMTANNRLFRIHIPLTITVKRPTAPRTLTLLYQFFYKYQVMRIRGKDKYIDEQTTSEPFAYVHIPLTQGINNWVVSSQWMVDCDKELWDPSSAYLIETDRGDKKVVKSPSSDTRSYVSVSSLYFPFTLVYWDTQYGVRNHWLETAFPRLVLRRVNGNEVYDRHIIEVISDTGDQTVTAEKADTGYIRSVSEKLLKKWENPYRLQTVFSNTWEQRSWAYTYRKMDNPALKAAFLSRIIKDFPDDIDAYELLLQNRAETKDSSLASRIYLQCSQKWPALHEHWFRVYLDSIADAVAQRAALMAYLRDHPDSGFAHQELVRQFIADQRWGPAKRLLQEWKRLEVSNAFLYAAEAVVAEAESKDQEERSALFKSIKYALPGDRSSARMTGFGTEAHRLFLLGQNFVTADKPREALPRLRKALTAAPKYYPAILMMGQAYLHMGVDATARDYFEQALSCYTNHPWAHAGLARIYQNAGKIQRTRYHRDALWSAVKPFAEYYAQAGNWTNVADLTRYVLDINTENRDVLVLHVIALIKLSLYDQASSLLYSLSDDEQRDPRIIALWADFCRILQEDTHCVICTDQPVVWRDLSRDAWLQVLKYDPRSSRARFELVLSALKQDDLLEALSQVKELYELQPSTALEEWIADICIMAAERNQYGTLPGRPDRSFIQEAREFYQRTSDSLQGRSADAGDNVSSHSTYYSPMVYCGLTRALELSKIRSSDPASILRQGLRRFSGSPTLRTAMLNEYISAQVSAPGLWVDYTNQLISLRPLDYAVQDTLQRIFTERKLKKAAAESLCYQGLSEVYWARILFNAIKNKNELNAPIQVYTLENQSLYRFKLRRHIFIDPSACYDWYSFRSRYNAYDLRHGLTRWWQKRELLRAAYTHFGMGWELAGELAGMLLGRVQSFGSFELNNDRRPESIYANELRRCFYEQVAPDRGTRHRFTPGKDVEQSLIFDPELFFGSISNMPLWLTVRARNSIPPAARHLFVPPVAAEAVLPEYEWDRIGAAWNYFPAKLRPCVSLSWPRSSTNMLVWHTALPGAVAIEPAYDGFAFYQRRTPLSTTDWSRTVVTPLSARGTVPVFKGIGSATLYGRIASVALQNGVCHPSAPPEFSVILATAPLTVSAEQWNDEALVMRWQWQNPSNAVLHIHAKTYASETAMQPGTPGDLIGTYASQTPATVYWKINRTYLYLGSSATNMTSRYRHNLSLFAWEHGCVLSLQADTCATPISYSFTELDIQQTPVEAR